MNYRNVMDEAAALGGGAAVLTLPMNLIAGQGLQQALINSGLAGVASAVGGGAAYAIDPSTAGIGGAVGMMGGNIVGNQIGLDRNEQGMATVGTMLNDEQIMRQIMQDQAAAAQYIADTAVGMLPDSKREKLMETVGPVAAQVSAETDMLLNKLTPQEQLPTERELRMAQALLDNAIATGAVQVMPIA